MQDWLLLLPRLALQGLLLLTFWLFGRALRRRWFGESTLDVPLLTFVWDYTFGLLIISFWVTLSGLVWLHPRFIMLLAGYALLRGLHAAWAADPITVFKYRVVDSLLAPWHALRSALAGRFGWARGLVLLYGAGLAGLALVGAAAPDMSQDSMWYHLSVPRAWTFAGSIAASPSNMPSNYALGMEVLYAALLLFGDEVDCSLLYAQVTLVLLLAIPALAAEAFGRRAGWIAAAFSPTVFAAATLLIPLQALNDFAAMLPMLLALLGAARPSLLPIPAPSLTCEAGARHAVFLGLFVGGAMAIKILVGGFLLPFLLAVALAGGWHARRRGQVAEWLGFWILLGLAAALAYAPWAVRNLLLGCGNPLFPFGQRLLPFRPEFEPIIAESARLNALFAPTPAGVLEALRDVPAKAHRFLNTSGTTSVVLLLAAPLCLAARGLLRWIGVALALQLGMLMMMRGELELVRYFTLCYPAAVVGLAGLAAAVWNARPQARRVLAVGIALFALAGAGSHAHRLREWTTFPTVAWPGRPVLTAASRAAFAQGKEPGGAVLPLFESVARHISPNAGVLLPDWNYPYYLNRRCVWACEVSPPILETAWRGLDAAGGLDWMSAQRIDYVLLMDAPRDPRLRELIAEKRLVPVHPAPLSDGRFTAQLFWRVQR